MSQGHAGKLELEKGANAKLLPRRDSGETTGIRRNATVLVEIRYQPNFVIICAF